MPLADLESVVREHRLEGIVAKRAGSPYRSGERCGDWLKWRANRGQEFVIGGYVAKGNQIDSILVGYYTGRDLMYAGRIRAGRPGEFRRVVLPHFEELQIPRCPIINLPDRTEGRWGDGLTAAKMTLCCWLVRSWWRESSSWNGRLRIDCVIRDSPESAATRTRET